MSDRQERRGADEQQRRPDPVGDQVGHRDAVAQRDAEVPGEGVLQEGQELLRQRSGRARRCCRNSASCSAVRNRPRPACGPGRRAAPGTGRSSRPATKNRLPSAPSSFAERRSARSSVSWPTGCVPAAMTRCSPEDHSRSLAVDRRRKATGTAATGRSTTTTAAPPISSPLRRRRPRPTDTTPDDEVFAPTRRGHAVTVAGVLGRPEQVVVVGAVLHEQDAVRGRAAAAKQANRSLRKACPSSV